MGQLAEDLVICFKLMKSCMGSGIYGYPTMFADYGIVYTIVLTVLSCAASVFGTYVYIDRNKELGKENSISTLGEAIVSKPFKSFVDAVVILKCVAVAAGYLNLAKKLFSQAELTSETISATTTAFILIGLSCVVILPAIFGSNLGRLRYLSYFGTFAVLTITLLSFVEAKDSYLVSQFFVNQHPSFLKNIGGFVFGFSCHQSILSIHNESNISERRMKFLIVLSFIGVTLLYLSFGFINYAAFFHLPCNPDIKDEVFLRWPHEAFRKKITMVLFATSLVSTVPFQLHPAKTYFVNMTKIKSLNYPTSIVMLSICLFLTTQSWYNFSLVSKYVSNPFNALLCFGFPVIFTLLGKSQKSYTDYTMIFYLSLFTIACFTSIGILLFENK